MHDNKDDTFPTKYWSMWVLVMGIYLLILAGIGFIAFWDQDFNDPNNTVGEYVRQLELYKDKPIGGTSSPLNNKENFTLLVHEIMKKDADNAGDLQELASQSFNIVLGAVLAFLSASATMLFQRSDKKPPEGD